MGSSISEGTDLSDLIAEAQDPGRQDDRAIREIVSRFDPLVRKVGRTWASGKPWREDVESAARFALTKAVGRHRGSVQGFPAYAKLHMKGAAKREAARWGNPGGWFPIEFNEFETFDRGMTTSIEDTDDRSCWGSGETADVIAELRPDQQHLLVRRYRDLANLAEIADETGCSVSAVSQRLTTVHRRLAVALAA